MEVYMNIQKIALTIVSALCLIGGSQIQAKHHHYRHQPRSHFGMSFNVGRPVALVRHYPVYYYRPVMVQPRPVVYYAAPRVSFGMNFGSFGMIF
jgi:hypothetical protein